MDDVSRLDEGPKPGRGANKEETVVPGEIGSSNGVRKVRAKSDEKDPKGRHSLENGKRKGPRAKSSQRLFLPEVCCGCVVCSWCE